MMLENLEKKVTEKVTSEEKEVNLEEEEGIVRPHFVRREMVRTMMAMVLNEMVVNWDWDLDSGSY